MIGDEEKRAVTEVIESKSLFRYYGPNLLEKTVTLEREFAQMVGVEHALAVSSGTASLKVALVALEVGPGDEVIVPSFTFIATIGAVVQAGAIPIFAEVDDSLNIDPEDVEAKITERTKAVIPVHFSGVACEMDRLMKIGKRRGIAILEDCAQACGAEYRGRMVGSWGDMGAFSLQLNKIITAGEGGVVTTDDRRLYERSMRYHDHGFLRGDWDEDQFFGENYRMNELSAAVALEQARKLSVIVGRMRERKRQVLSQVSDLPINWRRVPDEGGDASPSLAFFADSKEQAEEYAQYLEAENVTSGSPYSGRVAYETWPQILEKRSSVPGGFPFTSPHYGREVNYRMGMCPRSEDLVKRSVFIPVSPILTQDDANQIAAGLRKVADYLLASRGKSAS